MKKILLLTNNDVGLYKFRKELLEELIKEEYKIYISLPYGELIEPLKKMGCKFIDTPVDRRGTNPIRDFKLLVHYKKMIGKIKPDIVLTYTIKPNIYGGIACQCNKVPYLVTISGLGTAFQKHGMGEKSIVFLYKIALKRVKKVFFENIGNKEVFLENKIIASEKCIVLNGAGVNIEEYKFIPYPSNDKEIHFLFIGRIMQEKGIEEFFQVAERIKNEYKNVAFDVVGSLEENYRKKIDKLVKENIINFWDYQVDVKPFIEKASCIVLPSYHEGMANTLLEAAAMGRPLITSNIHGCKEAVIVNESGFLCERKSIDSLYDKVLEFIKLPYEKKMKMGEKSRKHIEMIFDKKQVVSEVIRNLEL